jgi:hypothetical protein
MVMPSALSIGFSVTLTNLLTTKVILARQRKLLLEVKKKPHTIQHG